MSTGLPTIFVSIASYRDTECQWTVRDLFDKARHPERVFVGLCWQFIPGEDNDCFEIPSPRPDQCRVVEFDARESKGVCWARHEVQKLWRGEDYVLQIDSHMRFAADWDESLLAMLAACPSERALLSSYPPPYVPPDKLTENQLPVMYAKEFNEQKILSFHSRSMPLAEAPAAPQPSAFCAAGFHFGPAAMIAEVPYDPHLYFLGEEVTLTVRLWTHGWDIFTPNRVVVWHDYTERGRRRHWHDHELWHRLSTRAGQRLRHILEIEATDDEEALREIERYGLGPTRTLAAYEAFSGIDFKRQLIDGKNYEQVWAHRPLADRRKRHADIFGRIWRNNSWGSEESRSGHGASLSRTVAIREQLPALLDFLGVRILCDAGCGDLNWMNQVTAGLRIYMGFDVVGDLVDDLRRRYGERKNHFFAAADIILDDLPQADAIICRDVLTHFPDHLVQEALRRFKASGARHLIATTHQRGRNDPIRLGGWQATDLSAPPFDLPPPRMVLSEGLANSTKALGVWSLADLP